ncbi:EscU/YscU/HrcU family type III secretion system export apparatus switch protein [Bradyrhizobium sp. STM 3557]|uniref:EscU/YscU/HrcU family type III secretion system export apparatus switch protein n=1 Tax=Bradyrhizobium sp. STM 3557 TaxID=578920 RepID=UPI00388D1D28
MSGQDSSEEKTLPPSAKKLREARKKGQIAHSKEAVTAVITTTALGYLLIRFPSSFAKLRDGLMAVPDLYDKPFESAVAVLFGRLGTDIALTVLPLVGLLVSVAIVTNIAINGGIVAAADPIIPKMERLDPVAGFKRMFGLKTLIELAKSAVKIAAVGILLWVITIAALQALIEIPACGLDCAALSFGTPIARLLYISVALFVLLGGFDISLQRWLFLRDMRMTKTEQKRERKDSEGDPTIRRLRQQVRRTGSASKAGLRNATFLVRSADTVLALRYAAPDAMVPVLVARGTQDQAAKLLDEAKKGNLPIVFDAAAVMHVAPRLKVGRMISPDMFQQIIGCMREARVI